MGEKEFEPDAEIEKKSIRLCRISVICWFLELVIAIATSGDHFSCEPSSLLADSVGIIYLDTSQFRFSDVAVSAIIHHESIHHCDLWFLISAEKQSS